MSAEEIVWFCAYTPLEILEASGFRPIRLFGDPENLEAADSFLHSALCPYVRACLAQALEGKTSTHAVFVNSCDGMRRLYDAWKAIFPDSFSFLMDLPRKTDRRGKELLALEFRKLLAALESFRGKPVSSHELLTACAERERSRLAYMQAAENLAGRARLEMARDWQCFPQNDLSRSRNSGKPISGVPVLLTGNLLNPAGLISILDQAGARTVWLDLCNGDRAFSASMTPRGESLSEALESLAERYLDRHPCARMTDGERRYRLLIERVHAVRARGVIYASLKFCDSYIYDFPRLRERLRREGIPLLRLESDYADGHAGQLLTRVEAFLEMIA